jgi:SAM-dependent methyltransferase
MILDVGCGDGGLASILVEAAPKRVIVGAEVKPRPGCAIPVIRFDGLRLPFSSNSIAAVLLVDVAHHTHAPFEFLMECSRVARDHLIIKDHFAEGAFDQVLLQLMDWAGNGPHGVPSPGQYWSRKTWDQSWQRLGWRPEALIPDLHLYPEPWDRFFGRGLHFIARLQRVPPAPLPPPSGTP